MPHDRPRTSRPDPAQRGQALLVQLLIGVIVVAVIAVPIVLVSTAKVRQRGKLLGEINTLINDTNETKTSVHDAYRQIRGTKQLAHATDVLMGYDKDFQALFRRSYTLRKRNEGEGETPTIEELVAMKRDLEAFAQRLNGHHQRVSTLLDLTNEAERAIQLARFYQSAIPTIRRHTPYEPNKTLLPQLAEATRQLGTGMGFAISGIQKYPTDLKGQETPTLIKTGIQQIRRVTSEVNDILRLLRGTETVEMNDPATNEKTLDRYIASVLRQAAERSG